MDEKVLKWLYDIKLSIEEIESYFPNSEEDFSEYDGNLMMKRAVERNLEIVSEAMIRIVKKDESFKDRITGSVAIIGLRNQIIHAYDNISDENIKSILTTHLILLKKEINVLINEIES